MSRELLAKFEPDVDAHVAQLPLLSLPLTTVLTGLYEHVDQFCHGDLYGHRGPLINLAAATVESISYIGQLLARCRTDPFEANALKAMEACDRVDPDGSQRDELRAYAQFCDLMPKVHRGYYTVEGSTADTFNLSVQEEAARYEELDTILNEMAQDGVNSKPPPSNAHFFELAKSYPKLDAAKLVEALRPWFTYSRHEVFEPVAVTKEGFESAAGTSLAKYQDFRAAWNALAYFFVRMNRVLANRIQKASLHERDPLLGLYAGTHSVLLRQDFVFPALCQVAGLDESTFRSLLSFFAIDPSAGKNAFRHCGDRVFPPLLLINDFVFFNPYATTISMCVHSLLYAVNQRDRKRFDSLVSEHFEPHLLTQATEIFKKVPGLDVVRPEKKTWKHEGIKGEIDLLVYDPAENVALHVQAKAALPPSSARMTERLEGRVAEGLEQLARFRNLPSEARDRILSETLQRPLRDTHVVDVLLTRTNFGTEKIWKQLGHVTPLNIAMVQALMRIAQARGRWKLASVPSEAQETLAKFVFLARTEWKPAQLILKKTCIFAPYLDYSNEWVGATRRMIWSEKTSADYAAETDSAQASPRRSSRGNDTPTPRERAELRKRKKKRGK